MACERKGNGKAGRTCIGRADPDSLVVALGAYILPLHCTVALEAQPCAASGLNHDWADKGNFGSRDVRRR